MGYYFSSSSSSSSCLPANLQIPIVRSLTIEFLLNSFIWKFPTIALYFHLAAEPLDGYSLRCARALHFLFSFLSFVVVVVVRINCVYELETVVFVRSSLILCEHGNRAKVETIQHKAMRSTGSRTFRFEIIATINLKMAFDSWFVSKESNPLLRLQ